MRKNVYAVQTPVESQFSATSLELVKSVNKGSSVQENSSRVYFDLLRIDSSTVVPKRLTGDKCTQPQSMYREHVASVPTRRGCIVRVVEKT